MLVLSRKPSEQILIGENIVITIVRIGPNTVRIGIEAPRDMSVCRSELADARRVEQVRDSIELAHLEDESI